MTLFDKSSTNTTLGNENPPFSYNNWSNIIFKGQASVENGLFTIDLVIPKNIDYKLGTGKISMYAKDPNQGIDASGSEFNIVIGGESKANITDTTPPVLDLYMDDLNFQDGGYTFSNTKLIGKLFDENGINLSNYGVGQSIEMTLDGDRRWELNEFYKADVDDFQSGMFVFPLFDLEQGEHEIIVKAWDTFNNPITKTISFVVESTEELLIRDLIGSPNPFSNETNISFRHNREGEDIEVYYRILSTKGELMMDEQKVIQNSPATIDLINWDGKGEYKQNFGGGLYFVNVVVRSLKDGAKNDSFCKLVYQY